MLARRLTTILPAMTQAEALETTRLHRVAGRTGDRTAFVTTRPFRAPHHTISDVGPIGGGQVPLPGEMSLAQWRALFGMSCLGSGAISPKPSANPSERVSSTYNLESILNLNIIAISAAQVMTVRDSGRATRGIP